MVRIPTSDKMTKNAFCQEKNGLRDILFVAAIIVDQLVPSLAGLKLVQQDYRHKDNL